MTKEAGMKKLAATPLFVLTPQALFFCPLIFLSDS